jgi:hypothetical protein
LFKDKICRSTFKLPSTWSGERQGWWYICFK